MLFDELISIYQARGFSIRSSISPFMLSTISARPQEDGTLTHLGRPGADWMAEPGDMSLTDLCFVEALGRARPASRVLVLGGRSGWNAIALALANPGAALAVLVDPAGTGVASLAPIGEIAAERGLRAVARAGTETEIGALCAEALGGEPDLVFFDANPPGGTFESAFAATRAAAAPSALHLFHGVVVDGALDRFRALVAPFPNRLAAVLSRTASGLGVLAPAGGDAERRRVVRGFCDPFAPIVV